MYTGFVNEGDWLHGEMEMYGFQDFYNITQDEEVHGYIEECWLTKDQAIRWLKQRIR